MIQAQEDRMKIIQRILAASEESRLEIIKEEDENIDSELFSMLATLMQAALSSQDENSAQQLNNLQHLLIEHSTEGKALKADSDEIQAAIQELQDLGEGLTREKLLDLVIAAPTEVRLRAYVQFIRPGMDYEFFQLLSARIEQASGPQKEKLTEIRTKLLAFVEEYDQDLAARVEATRENVETLMQAPDLEEAVKQNIDAIDELFIRTVQSEQEQARKDGNLDRSARLGQILSIIEETSEPPEELALVETLMEYVEDDAAMTRALEEHSDQITPELTQVLTSLIAQGQSVVGDTQGDQKQQQQRALDSIQKVYEAVLRYSMRQSFKK
jgi:hypothetical protein